MNSCWPNATGRVLVYIGPNTMPVRAGERVQVSGQVDDDGPLELYAAEITLADGRVVALFLQVLRDPDPGHDNAPGHSVRGRFLVRGGAVDQCGSSTRSMIWTTPFEAKTSGVVTRGVAVSE